MCGKQIKINCFNTVFLENAALKKCCESVTNTENENEQYSLIQGKPLFLT